jgi:aryl-alcohol dehydrogenase-like predicted oxidoreductase
MLPACTPGFLWPNWEALPSGVRGLEWFGATVQQSYRDHTAAQDRKAMSAIPGTGNPGHLAENVAAGALRLSADEMSRLSALHQAEA